MAKKKKASDNKKEHYKKYKALNVYAKNKERKLKKHLKKYPNDLKAKACLEKKNFSWPRKEPVLRGKVTRSEKRKITVKRGQVIQELDHIRFLFELSTPNNERSTEALNSLNLFKNTYFRYPIGVS